MPDVKAIHFEVGKPLQVALAYDEGREVKSPRSGRQFMYTLADIGAGARTDNITKVMFLPPVTAAEISAKHIRKNELFEICETDDADFPFTITALGTRVNHDDPAVTLRTALMEAMDMVKEASMYAEANDLDLVFSAEDVRSLAITLFIQQCKGN